MSNGTLILAHKNHRYVTLGEMKKRLQASRQQKKVRLREVEFHE